MPVRQLCHITHWRKINKSASKTITFVCENFGVVYLCYRAACVSSPSCWRSTLKLQYAALSDSSLLGRTAGCLYREISGLPLAQWAPLVLGLSIVTTGGRTALQQPFHSASATGWPTWEECGKKRKLQWHNHAEELFILKMPSAYHWWLSGIYNRNLWFIDKLCVALSCWKSLKQEHV